MDESDHSTTLTFLAENFEFVTGLFSGLSHEHRLQLADMFLSYAKAAAEDDLPKLISRFVTLH